jgi:hypothetical protein
VLGEALRTQLDVLVVSICQIEVRPAHTVGRGPVRLSVSLGQKVRSPNPRAAMSELLDHAVTQAQKNPVYAGEQHLPVGLQAQRAVSEPEQSIKCELHHEILVDRPDRQPRRPSIDTTVTG